MLSSPQTPAALLAQALPKNPKHGDVFLLPPGITGGGSSSLELRHRTECIGFALNYGNVLGSPDLVKINWVTTSVELFDNMAVELVQNNYVFLSMRFDQLLGWQGWGETRKISSYSQYIRPYHMLPACVSGNLRSYETICARKLPQEK